MEEIAEETQGMKNLKSTMVIYDSLQTKLDKYLPWREYKDYGEVLEAWETLWKNPEKYAEGEIELDGSEDEHLFRTGVAFGIEYERAYPSNERDEWPVDLEER